MKTKKLFRLHKRLLEDSLETTIEVKSLSDIIEFLKEEMPWAKNIKIKDYKLTDRRLPPEWGITTYYVVADFEGYTEQCIGMCNFYEDENV